MIVIYLLLLFFIVLFWDVTLVSFVVVGLFLAVSVDMKPTKKSTALIEEGEGGGSLMWVCHPLSNSQITTNVSYFSPPLVAILCYVHCLPFFFFFFYHLFSFSFCLWKTLVDSSPLGHSFFLSLFGNTFGLVYLFRLSHNYIGIRVHSFLNFSLILILKNIFQI